MKTVIKKSRTVHVELFSSYTFKNRTLNRACRLFEKAHETQLTERELIGNDILRPPPPCVCTLVNDNAEQRHGTQIYALKCLNAV